MEDDNLPQDDISVHLLPSAESPSPHARPESAATPSPGAAATMRGHSSNAPTFFDRFKEQLGGPAAVPNRSMIDPRCLRLLCTGATHDEVDAYSTVLS